MKILISFAFALLLSFFGFIPKLASQTLSMEVQAQIATYLSHTVRQKTQVADITVDSISITANTIRLYANPSLSYMLFRKHDVEGIYKSINDFLPKEYKKHKIELYTDLYKIEDYIPLNRKDPFVNKLDKPLITYLSQPFVASKGLQNHHLAVWQSHGWHYDQKLARWEWQRARVMQTVEDLYTQSYVLPFLVPMLENAGATILMPRERDTQLHEIIVDNDSPSNQLTYAEKNGKEKWIVGDKEGFSQQKEFYVQGENPFRAGTYRQVKTVTRAADESICQWTPLIPEKGRYAVYISYKTLKNSSDDALYTVYHQGGETDFQVNQRMGGGTWIFLGFFSFDAGTNQKAKIVLSNMSNKVGQILTADAVKIGGGMGNIARMPHPSGVMTANTKSSENQMVQNVKSRYTIDYQPETSGYPRYTEAARYWLQWAGIPDSVYSASAGKNDYTDDYQSRGLWVNYIAGGSSVLPKRQGLNIPIDLALAFHTDAGTSMNDSIIGTLGIAMTHVNKEKFENGKSRLASRDLSDLIMTEIVQDIRSNYEPKWTQRQLWNRSYSEARVPEVPTMLLELLSHQNFADMRYGLDPRFQFTVSRSIYKGMLKFIANQYQYEYVVQPLPINTFSTQWEGETQVVLKWQPSFDDNEPTAQAQRYSVYTRIGDADFDNGRLVEGTQVKLDIEKDKLYSFKITAVNAGGQSFPSEILSVCRQSNEKGEVLIVNGFDRLAAPFSFGIQDSIAGFVDNIDHGVPYHTQYNYIGSQYEYRRHIPWMDDDASGFGASNANYETRVIAGNTFDYPSIHGASIAQAGYSFVSCSNKAVMNGDIDLKAYPLVDLILGKQKQTKIGRGVFGVEFKTFPTALQEKIADYCTQGGNIFVSGAFVGSDLWDTELPQKADQDFAQQVLRYTWRTGQAAVEGLAKSVASPFSILNGKYEFFSKPNSTSYLVESPDAIEPMGENSHTIFRYAENNLSAGIASQGNYKTCILGFPFEAIKTKTERDNLMRKIVHFMDIKK